MTRKKIMQGNSTERLIEVQRLPNCGGVEVNLKRPDYSTYRLGSDHGLTKLLSDLDDRRDFLLITPFRGLDTDASEPTTRNWSQNEQAFLDLLAKMRLAVGRHWVSAYWLIGHWADPIPNDPGFLSDLLGDRVEYSWLLVLHDEDVSSEEWIRIGTSLANEYSCGPFIIRTNGAPLVRSEVGNFLWPLEDNEEVERSAILKPKPSCAW